MHFTKLISKISPIKKYLHKILPQKVNVEEIYFILNFLLCDKDL